MHYIHCYVALFIMGRQTVIDVLNILEEKQNSYIDTAEHIYNVPQI
jgi:hypothetical protein